MNRRQSPAPVGPELVGLSCFASEGSMASEGVGAAGSSAEALAGIFRPCPPDVLRAVTFRRAIRILDKSTPCDDAAYRQSRSVERIQYFWSHSWHGPARSKMLSLCLFHNFRQSFVCGAVATGLAALLTVRWAPEPELAAVPATLLVLLVSSVTLVLWPCQDSIFLDKACICQDDPLLKRQGILNIGFMLKHSGTTSSRRHA